MGVVIGGVLVIAMLALPRLFNAGATAAGAREQARKAADDLHATGIDLLAMQDQLSLERLKGADLDALVNDSALWQEPDANDPTVKTDAKERVNAQLAEIAGRLRAADAKHKNRGVAAREVPSLRLDASGLRTAIQTLDAAVKEQRELLKSAAAEAQQAAQADGGVPAAHYMRGAVELVEAGLLLAEARERRSELEKHLLKLVQIAQDLHRAQIETDQLKTFDAAPILTALEADLNEISESQKTADNETAAMTSRVEQARGDLQTVRDRLQQRQAELLELETKGFTAGDQESFDAYRRQYLAISLEGEDSLMKLQEREQLLSSGGLPDATVAGDDFENGPVVGGEPVTGLEQLERRLEAAKDNSARWAGARKALDEQVAFINARNEAVQADLTRYTARVRSLREELDKQRDLVSSAAEAASDQELDAIRKAQSAGQAFARAGTAIAGWRREARELKSEKDSANKNERLNAIVRDTSAEDTGPLAEAEALLTAGRAFALRVDGLITYMAVMERVKELVPDFSFDAAASQEELKTAQATATNELEKAVSTYAKLADGNAPTVWVHQALLGYLNHLLARIDSEKEELYLNQARQRLNQAVQGRQNSPYLVKHVAFLEQLAGSSSSGTPQTQPADSPATETPAEGEGG
jgi:hypothetical protein